MTDFLLYDFVWGTSEARGVRARDHQGRINLQVTGARLELLTRFAWYETRAHGRSRVQIMAVKVDRQLSQPLEFTHKWFLDNRITANDLSGRGSFYAMPICVRAPAGQEHGAAGQWKVCVGHTRDLPNGIP